MTINFEKEYDKNLDIDYETIADKVINAALDYEKCPYEAEVSLTLTDNKGIHDINKEFRNYGHSVTREYAFLIAHSMFHLMGDDHMEENDAKEMERRQAEILESLGIGRQI